MRLLEPLRNPALALLWGGLSLSAIGDQLYAVALTWIAVEVLGPWAGYLTALQALVLILAVLGIGRWTDRFGEQASMIGADVARALILLAVVAAWALMGGPSALGLVVAVVILSLGQAAFQPALQVMLPQLVTDARLLPAANGLLDATERSARLLGPGLIALLAGLVPVMHFLTIDAASFLASAAALLLIRRLHGAPARPGPYSAEGAWQSLARGVRAMARHPILGYVLATTGIVNGAWYAIVYLGLPLLIAEKTVTGLGGSGLGAYGCVIAAYGATNLLATLHFGSRGVPRRPQVQMFGGTLIVGAGLALLTAAAALPPAWRLGGMMAAAAFAAVGGPMKDIPLAVLRQTRLDPIDLAAAMRAYMAMNATGGLAAMLITPLAIAAAGVSPVILAFSAILMACALGGLVRHAGHVEDEAPERLAGETA